MATRTLISLTNSNTDTSKTYYCNGRGMEEKILKFLESNPTLEETEKFVSEKMDLVNDTGTISEFFFYLGVIDHTFLLDFSFNKLFVYYLQHFPKESFNQLQAEIEK